MRADDTYLGLDPGGEGQMTHTPGGSHWEVMPCPRGQGEGVTPGSIRFVYAYTVSMTKQIRDHIPKIV